MNKYQKYKEKIREWTNATYAKNKDDPEFKRKRNEYQKNYRNSKSEDQKQILREKDNQKGLNHRRSKPELYMFYDARKRSRLNNLEFNIEVSDIIIPEFCPVLKIPLFIQGGKRTNNSPSLDRIDNSKGYIKGNIMVISYRANSLKNNAKVEELQAIIDYMLKN